MRSLREDSDVDFNVRELQAQRRHGLPPSEVLESAENVRKTGRCMPDVWQEQVTEDSMPSPRCREEVAAYSGLREGCRTPRCSE